MKRLLVNEIIRVGGDPADEIWRWLCTRGPHGDSFSWGQTRDNPAGYVGIVHLEDIVNERSAIDPDFRACAREAARRALASDMPDLVRRGIQVLAVVAGRQEQSLIESFVSSSEAEVAADARACIFYLKRRKFE
jgi:dienelactone hydrolase